MTKERGLHVRVFWLFCLVLLITLLTLMDTLRGGRGAIAARVYTSVMAIAGVAMMFWPPLANIGNTPRAFAAGLLALVPPIWLTIVVRIFPMATSFGTNMMDSKKSCSRSASASGP